MPSGTYFPPATQRTERQAPKLSLIVRTDDRLYRAYLMKEQLVRHEAPCDRVGCRDPPADCRSSPLKLEAA
jgi:heat shock protein HspQ